MDEALAGWLTTPEGRAAIADATALLAVAEPLPASITLRRKRPELGPQQASAALAQAELARHPKAPGGWLLTRDGLEQGTDPRVAAYRAATLAAALAEGGLTTVIDATAGLGFDSAALVAAGLQVTAIERDPMTATLLAANVPGARVIVGDAMAVVDALPDDPVVIDPARRNPGQRTADGMRAQSERDPERWSPPLSWADTLRATRRGPIVVKAPPGLTLPPGWHGTWVSVQRTLVELTLWSEPITAGDVVVIDAEGTHVFAPPPDGSDDATDDAADENDLRTSAVGTWLIEPDPAVIAADAVSGLAAALDAMRVDAASSWLTADHRPSTPFARSWRIVEELPAATRELRAALRERGIMNPTVKTSGTRIDAARIRRELRATSGAEATIALVRVDERLRAYVLDTDSR